MALLFWFLHDSPAGCCDCAGLGDHATPISARQGTTAIAESTAGAKSTGAGAGVSWKRNRRWCQ